MRISVKKLTEWTIYLYILVMMISGSTGDLAVKIIRLVVMTALVLSLMNESSVKWIKSKYCSWAIVFFLYNVVMCQFAFSKSYAVDYTVTLFYVIVVDIFLCQYVYTHRRIILSILKVFMVGALLQAILVYGQNGPLVFLTSRSTENTSANTVGFYSAFAAVFAVYLYLNEKRKSRYIFIAIISIIFMTLTASRKAFLFFGIPLAFYYVMKSKNPIKVLGNIVLVLIAFVVSVFAVLKIPFLYELVGNRIEGMINGLILGGAVDSSTNTRLSLIEFGMTYFKQKPWFGYGMSNFKALVEVYRSWGSVYYAHNNYVELLVDCGLVGTLIYYSMYIYMIFSGMKNLKRHVPIQILAMGCLLSFIVGEYGMVSYNVAMYQLLLIAFFFILTDEKDTVAKIKGERT